MKTQKDAKITNLYQMAVSDLVWSWAVHFSTGDAMHYVARADE